MYVLFVSSLIKSHAVQEDLDWEIKVANVDEKKWDFSMRKGVLEPTILNKKRFSMS